MKFYQVDDKDFFPTLGDAHDAGKLVEPSFRPDVRIREVDVETDKAGVLQLLNKGTPVVSASNRCWKLTQRGGLVEIPAEQDAESRGAAS